MRRRSMFAPSKAKTSRQRFHRKTKRFDVLERAHLPAWFAAVRGLNNPTASAYLQALLLTGARREEMAALRWKDVDFQWSSIWVKDKVAEEGRKIPRTLLVRGARFPTPPQSVGFRSPSRITDALLIHAFRITAPVGCRSRALTCTGFAAPSRAWRNGWRCRVGSAADHGTRAERDGRSTTSTGHLNCSRSGTESTRRGFWSRLAFVATPRPARKSKRKTKPKVPRTSAS